MRRSILPKLTFICRRWYLRQAYASTYLTTDPFMLKHRCEWDPTYVDNAIRLALAQERIKKDKLDQKCVIVPARKATKDEILQIHDEKLYEEFSATEHMSLEELEKYSSKYFYIYVNNHSFDAARMAVGSAIDVVKAVIKDAKDGIVSNAMAVIRPPGHHAKPTKHCGFCLFNNVALAAKAARKSGIERVLIIDWDIHAGQGTMMSIEDDPGIKLINIHRYESGTYWPNLKECSIHSSYKQSIHIPLQEVGYGDGEYSASINIIARNVIKDWQPQLILVSCGFDSAFGDFSGLMRVTPAGYAHLVKSLMDAEIPLAVILEGGYFVANYPEATTHVLRALLREPVPHSLGFPDLTLKRSYVETLLAVIDKHKEKYPSLELLEKQFVRFGGKLVLDSSEYKSAPIPNQEVWETRDCFADIDTEIHKPELEKQILIGYRNEKPKPKISYTEKKFLLYSPTSTGVKLTKANGTPIVEIVPSTESGLRQDEIFFLENFVLTPLKWTYDIDEGEFKKAVNDAKGAAKPVVIPLQGGKILTDLFEK